MTQQKIIRNVTTMDRGPLVCVTTDDVAKVIESVVGEFTTFDIAEQMGVPEYPVRAAMSWLLKRGDIAKAGQRQRFTARMHEVYWATTYVRVVRGEPADFATLTRVLCGGY